MIRKVLFVLCLCIFPIFVYSQEKDFGIWYGISAEYPITIKLDFDVSATARTFDNASKIDQGYFEGGLVYKFNKFFSTSGYYRFTENLENDSKYHIRNKWFMDAKGSLPAGNFSFSIRLRVQVQSRTYIEKEKDRIPEYTGRIKLKTTYDIPKFKIDPNISFESFSPMFSESSLIVEKNRFSFGFEYNISKKHSVDISYIFQRDYLPHLSDLNILSANYNINF